MRILTLLFCLLSATACGQTNSGLLVVTVADSATRLITPAKAFLFYTYQNGSLAEYKTSGIRYIDRQWHVQLAPGKYLMMVEADDYVVNSQWVEVPGRARALMKTTQRSYLQYDTLAITAFQEKYINDLPVDARKRYTPIIQNLIIGSTSDENVNPLLPQEPMLTGRVVYPRSYEPVAHATLTLTSKVPSKSSAVRKRVKTDLAGNFRLAIEPGEYELTLIEPGYTHVHTIITAPANIEVQLARAPQPMRPFVPRKRGFPNANLRWVTIKGVVRNSDSGRSAAYLYVSLHTPVQSAELASVYTYEDGSFTMRAPIGMYNIEVRAQNYLRTLYQRWPITIDKDTTLTMSVNDEIYENNLLPTQAPVTWRQRMQARVKQVWPFNHRMRKPEPVYGHCGGNINYKEWYEDSWD